MSDAHPWRACPCCDDDAPAHAIIDVTCGRSKDPFRVRVPWGARWSPSGWGDRKRVRWSSDVGEHVGYEVSRGAAGVTLRAADGELHRVDHGYTDDLTEETVLGHRSLSRLTAPLRKAKPLKAGQRWITVHPNGPGEKGTPVLIEDNKDGTWSVIAGAGGRLQHLRLHSVKSEDEHKAEGKKRAAERREKEAARRAAQAPEAREQEKKSKADIAARRQQSQRAFIKSVRERLGGVSEDLDESELENMSNGARNLLVSRHHRRQLREAAERKDQVARELVEAEAIRVKTAGAVRHEAGQHAVGESARELADLELHLREKEEEERRAERRARQARRTAGKTQVGDRAAAAVVDRLAEAADVTTQLRSHGGRDDEEGWVPDSDLASEEVHRRALQAHQDAQILARAARGDKPASDTEAQVIQAALERAGVQQAPDEAADDVLTQQVLAREAARRLRRAEVQTARARRFEEIEHEQGAGSANSALAYSDMLGGIASEASAARRMGLAEADKTPVLSAEVAEIREVLRDAATLRQHEREFRQMRRAAETGDYKAAREAFELKVSTPTAVPNSVADDVRRELAENLRGLAAAGQSDYVRSVGAAHYDTVAEAGLAIAGQRFIDRPTMDAIGVTNSAHLLRHALTEAGHRRADVLAALEEHHVAQLEPVTTEAIAKANAAVPELSEAVTDVGSIEVAMSRLHAHDEDLATAQRAVGAALGRLEATAAMGQAYRGAIPDRMVVSADAGAIDTSLQWLHSIGLTTPDADYHVNYADGTVSIPRASWGKMLQPVAPEQVEQRRQALEIKAGGSDEAGWLPEGIVTRAATTFDGAVPPAKTLAEPIRADDVTGSLPDHVGSRLADGEAPQDILRDLLTPAARRRAADADAYDAEVKRLFPMHDEAGRRVKYADQEAHFTQLSDDFMRRRHGTTEGAFHSQDVGIDTKATQEAVFRALSAHPRAAAAFTATGELTRQQARQLRDHFYDRMGIDPSVRTDTAAFERKLVQLGPEPDPNAGTLSLFGMGGPSPEHREWTAKRDALLRAHPRAGLQEAVKALGPDPDPAKLEAVRRAATQAPTAWQRYVEAHGSLELAQRALQDELRGRFVETFHEHHGRLAGASLRRGVKEVANRERHVSATAGEEEAARLKAEASSVYASLRERVGGRFAAEGEGAVRAKHTRWLEEETIARQNQTFMFGRDETREARTTRTPGRGERWSLGSRAEAQIGAVVGRLGGQFNGSKVSLFPGLNMDDARVHQQRVIKLHQANGGRTLAALGTGSGKSLVTIGAFTDAHARGEVEHAIFAVPKAVEQQFPGEMLRFTKPGAYSWVTGAELKTHEARVRALQDTSTHMKVMTHESLRDTLLRVMADHHRDGDVAAMRRDLSNSSSSARSAWMREAMEANNIKPWMFVGDEAHRFTSRAGQDPSGLHTVMSAASHPSNAAQAMFATATPVKNDASEAYSMASLVDPETYGDRFEFMQSFGSDLANNPHALRRELAHRLYTARVDPDTKRHDSDNPVVRDGKKISMGAMKLNEQHQGLVDAVSRDYQAARQAHARGVPDVEAVRRLSPGSFAGQPAARHAAIAARLGPSLGILHQGALRRAVNQAPPEFNTKLKALHEVVAHDLQHGTWTDRSGVKRRGKPAVIFSDSLAEARMIHEHMEERGIRSGLYHGGLSSREREAVRTGFQPEGDDEPTLDIVVATSAAEAGINMQQAKVVHHYDVPMTDKSHAQRSGRAYRQGQQGDVDVHDWHTDTDFERRARRRLEQKSGLAAVMQTPLDRLDQSGLAGSYHRALTQRHQGAA